MLMSSVLIEFSPDNPQLCQNCHDYNIDLSVV